MVEIMFHISCFICLLYIKKSSKIFNLSEFSLDLTLNKTYFVCNLIYGFFIPVHDILCVPVVYLQNVYVRLRIRLFIVVIVVLKMWIIANLLLHFPLDNVEPQFWYEIASLHNSVSVSKLI